MGKGDRKSRKGKIAKGSFGNTRPRPHSAVDKTATAAVKPKAEKKAAAPKKATTTKKTTAKKKTEKADK